MYIHVHVQCMYDTCMYMYMFMYSRYMYQYMYVDSRYLHVLYIYMYTCRYTFMCMYIHVHVCTCTCHTLFFCTFRPQYFKLIDKCVSQVVLHRTGLDPDFHYTQKFILDVDSIIGKNISYQRREPRTYFILQIPFTITVGY